jgi:hypothetical protein
VDVLIYYVPLFGVLYLAWCNFAMGPTKKHQILCKSRKKCDGDPGLGRKHWPPRPKQGETGEISKVKSIVIIFFDIKGIAHKEFVLAGQTVNSAYYCDVLRRLRENLQRLRPEL